jgi:23S rRNA (pseudouridine1915-N3)-methyltransferase
MREIHPGRFDPWAKHAGAAKIFLDALGKKLDSAGFIAQVEKWHDMVFIVGGSDGLPPEWRARADLLLAISPMTMPHELARVVLAEQIYRALTTMRGHPYPR